MSHALVQPMIAMMVLTSFVWLYMYVRRLGYIFAHGIEAQDLATPEQRTAVLPEAVNRPANNLGNLFELPVVFYAISLLLLVLQESDPMYINLAWGYVALRAAHSAIHCTVNIVTLRFAAYLLSSIVLWIMLGRLAVHHF